MAQKIKELFRNKPIYVFFLGFMIGLPFLNPDWDSFFAGKVEYPLLQLGVLAILALTLYLLTEVLEGLVIAVILKIRTGFWFIRNPRWEMITDPYYPWQWIVNIFQMGFCIGVFFL